MDSAIIYSFRRDTQTNAFLFFVAVGLISYLPCVWLSSIFAFKLPLEDHEVRDSFLTVVGVDDYGSEIEEVHYDLTPIGRAKMDHNEASAITSLMILAAVSSPWGWIAFWWFGMEEKEKGNQTILVLVTWFWSAITISIASFILSLLLPAPDTWSPRFIQEIHEARVEYKLREIQERVRE